MKQNIISIAYLIAGFAALLLVSHLLLQIMTLIFAVYAIYTGFSMRSRQPHIIHSMNGLFRRFFSVFK